MLPPLDADRIDLLTLHLATVQGFPRAETSEYGGVCAGSSLVTGLAP